MIELEVYLKGTFKRLTQAQMIFKAPSRDLVNRTRQKEDGLTQAFLSSVYVFQDVMYLHRMLEMIRKCLFSKHMHQKN